MVGVLAVVSMILAFAVAKVPTLYTQSPDRCGQDIIIARLSKLFDVGGVAETLPGAADIASPKQDS